MVSNRYLMEIFQVSPIPSLLLKANSPHFEMIMANPAFFKAMGVAEDQIAGRKVFEVFPSNPNTSDTNGVDLLRASFEKVIATGKSHVMERLRYDIPNRELDVFQVRYWEPQNHPIIDEFGNIDHILHMVVDVTEEATSKQQLEASQIQFKELLHSLNVVIWEANPDTFQCSYVSPQVKDILGYDPEEWYESDFWKDKIHPDDRERVLENLKINIKNTNNYQIEYRIIRSDGSVIWVTDRVSIIKEFDKPLKLRGVLTDISERKKAEWQTIQNEKKIQKILDQSLDIICTIDLEGKFKEINAAVEKIWGYSPEELIDRDCFEFMHEEDRAGSANEIIEMVGGKNTIFYENRFITKEGKTVPMIWSVHLAENEQRIFCVGKDATKIKEAEQLLKYNEERFKNLVQHGADYIAILDNKGSNTYVSPSAKSISGWEPVNLVGKSIFSLIHEDDVDRVKAKFQNILNGENVFTDTFRIQNNEEKYIWMEAYAINMLENPVINGVVINARNVTERKKYLEWHEYVNKATNDTIFDWDLEEDQIHWGGNITLLLNSLDDIQGFTFMDYTERLHPEDKERMLTQFSDLLKNKSEQQLKSSCRLANSEGEYLNVEIDSYFIRNKTGHVIRMIGAIRDVSFQRKFEEELKNSNQRYELVTQATSDVIWDWDLNTNKLFWGGGIEKLFGYNPESLKPHIRSWYSRIHPKDYKKITAGIKEVINSGKNIWEGEYRFLRADGDYNYVYDRGFVVRDARGKALRLVGAMQNIHQDKMREVEDNLKLEISNIFTHKDTIDSCLKATLKAISKVHEYAYSEIWMTRLDNSSISLRAHYGKGRYIISENQTQFSINEGLPGKIWSSNQPKFIESIIDDSDYSRKNLAIENDYINIAGFPIQFNEQVKAVIIFFYKRKSPKSTFSPFTQDIFGFLGSEIQRKKAELELDHFFELSPDLMSITDVNGIYLKINNAFEVLLGYNKEELYATHFIDLIHPDDRHIFANINEKVESGQIMNHESRMRKKSGHYLWLSWTAKPFPGDGLIIGVGKDISQKKIQEETIVKSHQETLNILESIQDGFIAIDKDWSVSYWNNAAEKIIQTKREDILGNNLWHVFTPSKEFKYQKEFARVIEEGISVRFEEYYAPQDIWVMVSAYPSETGMTAYIKDITESKIASLKLIQFKKVIENSKDEIAIISTVNESVYLNPAFIESFGYGSEMIKQLGGPQKIFANEEQAAEVFSDLLSGRHWKGDVELIGKSKSIRSYYISAGPINDDNDKLIAVFIIHTDISKRKETEGKIKSLYSDLQQQAKELASYREELTQFANIASKDLKEPLNYITAKLKKLKTNYAEKIKEDGLVELHQALESSERMQVLISGLLEYTLTENLNAPLERIDLNMILEEVKDSLRTRIHDKFAIIDDSKLPAIKGNQKHFLMIFKSLISTALESHMDNSRINILFDSDDNHYIFFIKTDGTLKDPSELERISNFLKKPETDMEVGKYIALATLRKIVGKYKGRLGLKIESPNNSTYTFTIAKNPVR